MHALPGEGSLKRWRQQQRHWLLLLLQLLLLLLQLNTRCLNGQQATGGDCVSFFPADAAVLSYCKNGAKCGTLLELVCDCSALQTTEKFFAGPDCSVEQSMNYVMGSRFWGMKHNNESFRRIPGLESVVGVWGFVLQQQSAAAAAVSCCSKSQLLQQQSAAAAAVSCSSHLQQQQQASSNQQQQQSAAAVASSCSSSSSSQLQQQQQQVSCSSRSSSNAELGV
ncbi:hypothetical protein Emag_005586 [Eimeria magna]